MKSCGFVARRSMLCLIVGMFLMIGAARSLADNRTLQAELEATLKDKVVVSKIMLAGKGTPRGYQASYSVNTLVYTDLNEVKYRIEFGLMRTDIGPNEMQRRFEIGTIFHVKSLVFKDDRLELGLESRSGDAARLKLMFGRGWQAKFDEPSVQSQLARVLVVEEDRSSAVGATTPSLSAWPQPTTIASNTEYQRDPNAPPIPGRLSQDEVRSVLRALDQESQNAVTALFKDASGLARGLIAFKQAYNTGASYGANSLLRRIDQLEDRLGKALQPERDQDVVELNELFKQCVRFAQIGQARDESGRRFGAGRNSAEFESSVLSRSATNLYDTVSNHLREERDIQGSVRQAKTSVVSVEQALDKQDFLGAERLFRQMSTVSTKPSSLQQYLDDTHTLQQDLSQLGKVRELALSANAPLSSQLNALERMGSWMKAPELQALSRAQLANEKELAVQQIDTGIDGLPAYSFRPSEYSLPPHRATYSTLQERIHTLEAMLSGLELEIRPVLPVKSISFAGAEANFIIEEIGTQRVQKVQHVQVELAKAENVRDQLLRDVSSDKHEFRELSDLADALLNSCLISVKLLEKYSSTHIPAYLDQMQEQHSEMMSRINKERPALDAKFWSEVDAKMYKLTRSIPEEEGFAMSAELSTFRR